MKRSTRLAGLPALLLTTALVALPATQAGALDNAPGSPGSSPTWAPADKTGFGTSKTLTSKVWYTLENGGLSEIYYPDLDTPSVRDMQFIVTDGSSFAERESDASDKSTRLADPKALTFTQTNTAKSGKWRLTKTYVTDPDRSTVMMDVTFESLTGQPLQLYALYNPRLSNGSTYQLDDKGWSEGSALVAEDGQNGSALAASPAFTATSSGYKDTSDGWSDLKNDRTMDWHYDARQQGGNLVQTGKLALTGLSGSQKATVALGFGDNAAAATSTVQDSLASGFPAVSAKFASGWHDYVATLKPPPASLKTQREKDVYNASVMVLASHEDKTHRGAFVASPTMPWAWGTSNLENPSTVYHHVWARDVSGKAGGLLTAGDTAAAERALTFLFTKQQKSDGSFPQNSDLDGNQHWNNTQLDEVAAPILLAWTLKKTDADTWSHVKAAADYIAGNGPVTTQERWENQGGYSPATIAAEIAGLVCAAEIAKANGDTAKQQAYLAKADDWQSHLKDWTVTTNGPYGSQYFLRLTKDGKPNQGTTYKIGDSGPANADQRAVVDPSFLETVRLGVLSPSDPAILSTLPIVDQQLGENTPNGQFWHRYNWDGYGETKTGAEWNFGYPDGSLTTIGRLWVLFAGERGEYELAAGKSADARLAAMAAAATEAGLISEQVWDHNGPGAAGTPSSSATPLGWAHGQYVRLAWSIAEGRSLSTPSVVACRYLKSSCDPTAQPPGAPGQPAASDITTTSVKLTWTAAGAGSNPIAGYDVYAGGEKVASATGLSATVTGLTPSTTYSFTVKAKDSTGLSGPASPATSVTTAPDQQSGSCKVSYHVGSDWGSGFVASVTIANTGTAPVANWALGFSFGGNQRISSGWSAIWGQNGAQVTARGESWNTTLNPGASITAGFNATYSGANARPTAFTLNGSACTLS
ncbi:glycoside hydrolase family 15 protein [Nonomuraea sp. NPDC050783]|uniref:glycoside hydrolase family 15 protein n=1 Tax=Nonomuraea sp. NPDC050783 TaxID=3154634 RepID=UPI003467E2BF